MADTRAAADPAALPERERLQLDLSPGVAALVGHVSAVLGVPRSQLALQGLLRALPELLAQADQVKQRAGALAGNGKGKR
jgi:hypothetical protein